MRFTRAAAILFAAGCFGIARPSPVRAAPDDIIMQPLVLDEGAVELRLTAEINVQARKMGRPLSLAPDAWWGIAPRWTIGLIHSAASLDRIESGSTFCVRQTDDVACPGLYRGSGVDVRFSALDGTFAVAPRMRVVIRNLDPFKPAMTVGGLVRWAHGRFAVAGDPYVRIPLANRHEGNRAQLFLPIWFTVQPATGWAIGLHTGYNADFAVLRDGGHAPLSLSGTSRVTRAVDVGIEAGWFGLLTQQHDVKQATVMLSVDWHP